MRLGSGGVWKVQDEKRYRSQSPFSRRWQIRLPMQVEDLPNGHGSTEMAAGKGLIEQKVEETWARAQRSLEEGTFEENSPKELEFFSREVLPPLAVRAFFKGVGELDEEAADVVLREVGAACGDFELGLMERLGFKLPTADIDAFLTAHETGEKVASGGLATVTREGNSATLVIKGGCVCPLVKTLGIEPTQNHCLCTRSHLRHVYETGLGRPVRVELIETYLRGGDSCTIRMSWE